MPIVYDTHLHSMFSTDSDTPFVDHINQAMKLGLKGICMTDHIDYDFPADQMDPPMSDGKPPFVFDTSIYQKTLQNIKTEFPTLNIDIGIECGLQTQSSVIEENILLCQNPDWDYIIGSLHLVSGLDPYYPTFWEGKDPNKCIWQYFEELLQNVEKFHEFNSLGHLDYIVRYAPKDFSYNPKDYFEIIREILLLLLRKDIALEINSSGLRVSTMPNPHMDILSLYTSLGGELITIGSDAHTPKYIGYGFDQIKDIIKKVGLQEYVTYHKRKPTFHSL